MRTWFVFAHLSPLRESGPLQAVVLLMALPGLWGATLLGTDGLGLPSALAILGAIGLGLWAPGLLFVAAAMGAIAGGLGPLALLMLLPLLAAWMACHAA